VPVGDDAALLWFLNSELPNEADRRRLYTCVAAAIAFPGGTRRLCISSATPKQAAGEEPALRAKRSGGDVPIRRVVPDWSVPLWTALVGACLGGPGDRGVVGQQDAVARYLFRW